MTTNNAQWQDGQIDNTKEVVGIVLVVINAFANDGSLANQIMHPTIPNFHDTFF